MNANVSLDILFIFFKHEYSRKILSWFLTRTRTFPNSCNQRLTDGLGAYRPGIHRPRPDDRCSSRRSRNRSPCRNKLGCPCPCPWSPGR